MDEDIWFQVPFDIKFNRQGIQGLVVPREMESRYIDVIRTIVSQMNFGVELLHKPDGAFKVMEKTYFGDCDGLVNISRETQGNEVPRKEAYEIVTMAGLKKKQGEVLVIKKTRNLTNCADKRDYFFGSERNPKLNAPMVSEDANPLANLVFTIANLSSSRNNRVTNIWSVGKVAATRQTRVYPRTCKRQIANEFGRTR